MSSKIKILIGVVLVVVLAVVAVMLLTGGGDDGGDGTSAKSGKSGGGGGGGGDDGGGDGGDAGPSLRTVSVKRAEGTRVTAGAAAFIKEPTQIWMRISAAPKQKVTGSWNVSCAGGGGTEMATFTVTPPYLLRLKLPRNNAKTCVGGASARIDGKGRLKVAILKPR